MSAEIIITGELTTRQQREVAEIFFSSFKRKFRTLCLFTKDARKAVEVLCQSINFRSGLYAI